MRRAVRHTDEFRRHVVRAAQHELRIRIAQQLRPEIVGVSVLNLRQILASHQHLKGAGPDGGESPPKVRDDADVIHLVQDDIDRDLAALFRCAVGVTDQLDEQEGEEQGRQELQGGILIVQDDVIDAFALPRLRQVNVGVLGDLPDGLALEDLKPGAQSQNNACPHIVAGLAEEVEGGLGRMG